MKLRAIRLKEFRRFSEPVTIEGLTGKLDVLAAPNEDGKSTLFEAVRTVISERYNAGAGSKKMKAIQPYAGGAPLIEVDFDLDGREYRLRKQYIKKPDAVLTDRASGRDIARKDDVEDWLNDNLKARLPFGLFWVAQHGAASPALMDKNAGEHASALRTAVEAEVGAIAGGAVRDAVRKSIGDDLSVLITTRGAKKNGPYDLTLQTQKTLEGDLEAACQRRNDAEARYTRLEELRDERNSLVSSPEYSALDGRIEAAQKALDDALHANAQLRDARKEQEASAHQVVAVAQRLADFDARANDFSVLSTAQAEAKKALEALSTTVAEAEATFAQADTDLKTLTDALAALRVAEKDALLAEQRNALSEGISRRQAVLGSARETVDRIADTRTFLAEEQVTPDIVQTLQTVMGEVAALSLMAEQQTPKVTMHYDAGAEGSVHADGQTLAQGLVRPIREKTDLTIDGVGRLAIDPGASRDRDEDKDDLKAYQAQRDQLMDRIGVTSLAEAQRRAAKREARAAALKLDEKRLEELAPGGVETLERALGNEQAKLDALPDVDPVRTLRPRAEIAEDIAALEPKISEQTAVLDEHRTVLQNLKVQAASAATDVTTRAERLGLLQDSLDRDQTQNLIGREANRISLAQLVADAEGRQNEAARKVSAWQDAFVDDEGLAARKTALTDVQRQAATSQAVLRKIDQERGEIDAVLRETTQDGIDEVISGIEAELERAGKDVAYHERQIAAMKLLADTLDDVAEDTRATYTRPIVERLSPYVDAIFPGANFSFTEEFSSKDITRNGAIEQFGDVSMGTQEQIGVLIRLGFARLFADRGQPLPLILDDALVYSDDQRIERMFDALRLAANEHQVLILTCRMRAFEGLGGNRLQIQPCAFG